VNATITTPVQPTGTYTIDPGHSTIGFVARHAIVTKVRGTFSDFEGTVSIDAEHPSNSSAQVTIKAMSSDTHNAARDAHLRSNDFFGMATYPGDHLRFHRDRSDGDTEFRVTGDLTLKGVTKPVAVDVEFLGAATDPSGDERIGFEGKASVNRTDWGVSWNAALGRRCTGQREGHHRARCLRHQERLTSHRRCCRNVGRTVGCQRISPRLRAILQTSSGAPDHARPIRRAAPSEAMRPPSGTPWNGGAARSPPFSCLMISPRDSISINWLTVGDCAHAFNPICST
jgi:polyisoprenoid-binding protein YceI